MWIYYYATFGPGSQSSDYGFKRFGKDWTNDDIKEWLFNYIESCGYSISLKIWKVKRPPAKYVNSEIENTKVKIEGLKEYLKTMEEEVCFVSEEKDGEDAVLQKNLFHCIISDLLKRLHKAGFMYSAEDIGDWRYGKKQICEPSRSKILRIMRGTEKYPSAREQMEKNKKKRKRLEANMTASEKR